MNERNDTDAVWESMLNAVRKEADLFRDVAYAFATACEIDGFGGVKSVNLKYLTAAIEMYSKLLKEYPDE